MRGLAYTIRDGVVKGRVWNTDEDSRDDAFAAMADAGFDPETLRALGATDEQITKAAEVEGALPGTQGYDGTDTNAGDAEALYNEAQRRFSLFGNARHFGATLPLIARISRYNDDGSSTV